MRDPTLHIKAIKVLDNVLELFGDVEELQVSNEDMETIQIKGDIVNDEEESEEENSEIQEENETRFFVFCFF